MGEVLQFIRDLLRLDASARSGQPFHDHERSEPFDQRRPLYIGRGFICLGNEPVKSRYRGSRG